MGALHNPLSTKETLGNCYKVLKANEKTSASAGLQDAYPTKRPGATQPPAILNAAPTRLQSGTVKFAQWPHTSRKVMPPL